MDIVWSSKTVPKPKRAAAWAAVLSRQIFPVRAEVVRPQGFEGEFRLCAFGPTAFLRVRSRRQTIRRGPDEIGDNDADWLFVSTMTRGTGYLHHAGGITRVPRGAVSFVDGGQPFALEFRRDFAYVSALVLRRDMLALLPEADRAHGTVIPAPAGPALGAFLATIESTVGNGAADENRLYDHFLGLAAAALTPFAVPATTCPQAATPDTALLARIKAHLIANLGDEMTTRAVADRFGISERRLQRLFQRDGISLTLWVRGQRLERCARDLADDRQGGRTITTIAADYGFYDMSYFSRCFRTRFGIAPGAYRRQAH